MQRVQFKKCGVDERDGTALYALEIDGKAVERDIPIDRVIRIIGERDGGTDCHASAAAPARNDKADRTPAAFRTPETGRGFETRG